MADGDLSSFRFEAIMNNATKNSPYKSSGKYMYAFLLNTYKQNC